MTFGHPPWVKVDEFSGFAPAWRVTCIRCHQVEDFGGAGDRPDEMIEASISRHRRCRAPSSTANHSA